VSRRRRRRAGPPNQRQQLGLSRGHGECRAWLAGHAVPFVLATRSNDTLPVDAVGWPGLWPPQSRGPGRHAAPGTGAHGRRLYDWACVGLDPAGLPAGWGYWLLIRRQITPDGARAELAFYRCAGPRLPPARSWSAWPEPGG
jgi:hypothetical protein